MIKKTKKENMEIEEIYT